MEKIPCPALFLRIHRLQKSQRKSGKEFYALTIS